MLARAYYSTSVARFLEESDAQIVGALAASNQFGLEVTQRDAWVQEIAILKAALSPDPAASILLEFTIPRMGKRADTVLLWRGNVVVIEFKIGARTYDSAALDQALDYALDLKNFHEGSHDVPVVPILVATNAPTVQQDTKSDADGVSRVLKANRASLKEALHALSPSAICARIDMDSWLAAGYRPTPTIVEAARCLYQGHNVAEISRSDAEATNLSLTGNAISEAIAQSRANDWKSICFVTGVPGSGKTLAGLNVATARAKEHADEHAVFLSGNGPLVDVLREALSSDEASRNAIRKKDADSRVAAFIQNIHHFRDEYLRTEAPPVEHVVVFDESQRAWDRHQASKFMREKRGLHDFDMSEPEFLLSVMDRHQNWCVVVCLVGGGQEINTGEAGIGEWWRALQKSFPDWRVWLSGRVAESDDATAREVVSLRQNLQIHDVSALHLSVSLRSYRAEHVSEFVGLVLSSGARQAKASHELLGGKYTFAITRDLARARQWLRASARASERYGLVASSNGMRLKAHGLHVKAKIKPADWFLRGKTDVRSSFALEDVATEFDIQGLELDWAGVCWDGDLRRGTSGWEHFDFVGSTWRRISSDDRRKYLTNAYRVLLTRARQGVVVFVPPGDASDATRLPEYYDRTYDFLRECGFEDV